MANSIMYQEDGYVVLETNQPEELLTESELLKKIEVILATSQSDLPSDIAKFNTRQEQAQYLLHNYCEFNTDDDNYLQWYVVRWEKK
ncbi:chlororespiratory reduction protein 7 [Geminocystis sp. GBBB08]|uniref:chlororespiratory reduction protein 7 n=1 Tax=Geminocystis sp. GBBB08 TaxID=2604140 RepID=UPI0027E26C9E|nr:chlororespiratory reduction protein 7 [Geminocystis sp. GBBB08]MBL1211640.1 chlororespiratory reduction protein 7 [Geminocystis sp. GBBB08]